MKKFVVLSLVGLTILTFGATGYAQQLYELEKGQMVRPLYTMQPGNYQEMIVGEKPPVLEFKASGFIDVISDYNRNVNEVSPSAWTASTPLFGLSDLFYPKNAVQDPPINTGLKDPTTGLPITVPVPKGVIGRGPLTGAHYGAAFNKTQSFMLTRARLRFDALMGKQVSGTIFFEMDATRWGERNGVAAQRNQAGDWNADSAAVEVKNAFITAALPPIIPVPTVVNAGILPWATRPVVNYTDGTGINITFRPDPAQIKFTWMKALENQDFSADDADVYGVEAKVNLGTVTVAGYGAYYNMNTYPFQSTPSYNALTGVWSTVPGFNSGSNTSWIANNTADFAWLGAYCDGKLGPLYINTDFAYAWGEVKAHGDNEFKLPAGADTKVKYGGWIVRAAVDFPWERFNFGVAGMYATGADLKKTSNSGLPGTANAYPGSGFSTKVGSYVVPPNAEHGYDDESIVFYGQGPNGLGRPGSGFNNGGTAGGTVGSGVYGGTWFAKIYANFKPSPWYRVTLYGMYIGDTVKNGNKLGNAVTAAGNPRNDAFIGVEFGIFNDIQIYRNLQFRFGAGYLVAKEAFDMWDQRSGTAANGYNGFQNVSPHDPYVFMSKLIYVF